MSSKALKEPISLQPQNDSCGPCRDQDCRKAFRTGLDGVQSDLSYSFATKQKLLEILIKYPKRYNEVGYPKHHNPESGFWLGS